MSPSDKRFCSDKSPAIEIYLWLIKKFELIVRDSALQFFFEQEPRFKFRSKLRFEEKRNTPPLRLRTIEREVCICEEIFTIFGVFRKERPSNARFNPNALALCIDGLIGEYIDYFFTKRGSAFSNMFASHRNREFVASETSDKPSLANN